jgi:tetratricopeptide (TPR) repeat protein
LQPADRVSDDVVRRLAERASRTPQLLVELVLGLKAEGLLVKRPAGDGYAVASEVIDRLPSMPLVEWGARRELASLGAELRGHARLVAVVNAASGADHVGVANALDDAGHRALVPLDAFVALEQLAERGVLQAGRDRRWRFRKPVVRDLLITEGAAAELVVMHQAALGWFERSMAVRAPGRAARLAVHAQGTGQLDLAATYWLEAGLEASAGHAMVDADQALTFALSMLTADDPRRLDALRARGLVRYRVARYADARVDFQAAQSEAQRQQAVRTEIDTLLWWATALDWMADFTGARERIRRARALYDQAPFPELQPMLLFNEGRSECRFENFRAATVTLRRVLALPELALPANEETRIEVLVLLLYLLPMEQQLEEAEALLLELRARCVAAGDRFHLGAALGNTRSLFLARGEFEKGLAAQVEAADIAHALGELSMEYITTSNIAELLMLGDDPERALVAARAALDLETRSVEVASGPWARLIYARACVFTDRLDEARAEVAEIDARLQRGEGLLPHERLVLDAVRAVLTHAPPATFEALAKAATAAEVWDELMEIATLWLVGFPEARGQVRAVLPEPLTARIPRALARRLTP